MSIWSIKPGTDRFDLPVSEHEQVTVDALLVIFDEPDGFLPTWEDVPYGVKKALYALGREFLRRYEIGGDYEELAKELCGSFRLKGWHADVRHIVRFALYNTLIRIGVDSDDFPNMPIPLTPEFCISVIDSHHDFRRVIKLMGGSTTVGATFVGVQSLPKKMGVKVAGINMKMTFSNRHKKPRR